MISPVDAQNWSLNKPGIAQVELSRAFPFLKHILSGKWNVYMAIYKQWDQEDRWRKKKVHMQRHGKNE